MSVVDSPLVGLDEEQVKQVLNFGAAFACINFATDILERGNFAEEEEPVFGWLPEAIRLHTLARLLDASEALREELRHLDGLLLARTAG